MPLSKHTRNIFKSALVVDSAALKWKKRGSLQAKERELAKLEKVQRKEERKAAREEELEEQIRFHQQSEHTQWWVCFRGKQEIIRSRL